jgi:hypothetical protein
MHTRRLIMLLLGLWLGASVLMDWISIGGTDTIPASFDSARQREPIMVRTIGEGPVRELLRYQTAELNRHHTYFWGFAQIGMGVVLVLTVLFATNGNKPGLILSSAMLLLVMGMQFAVVPAMLEQDRALDFAVGDVSRERAAFAGSRNTYMGMEVMKLFAGLGLAGVLLYRERGGTSGSTRRRRRLDKIDVVDYANHGRVDR